MAPGTQLKEEGRERGREREGGNKRAREKERCKETFITNTQKRPPDPTESERDCVQVSSKGFRV
jgi:hypothetical protein